MELPHRGNSKKYSYDHEKQYFFEKHFSFFPVYHILSFFPPRQRLSDYYEPAHNIFKYGAYRICEL